MHLNLMHRIVERKCNMKKKAIIVFLYILLIAVACAVGIHWFFLFMFDNITVNFKDGVATDTEVKSF